MFYGLLFTAAIGLAIALWLLLSPGKDGAASPLADSLVPPLVILAVATVCVWLVADDLNKIFLVLSLGLAGLVVWLLAHSGGRSPGSPLGKGHLSALLIFGIAAAAAFVITTPPPLEFLSMLLLGGSVILLWSLVSHLARQQWTPGRTRRLLHPLGAILAAICLGTIVAAILHSPKDPDALNLLQQSQLRRIGASPSPTHAELLRRSLAMDAVLDAAWLDTEIPILIVGSWNTGSNHKALAARICDMALELGFEGAQVHVMEQPSGDTVLQSRKQLSYLRCVNRQ